MDLARLRSVLHPLDRPPAGPCWNLADLDGLPVPCPPADAAVLVGLVPGTGGTQVLLTRRVDSLRRHAGQVSFPGGRVDAGDADAVSAALRETREEVGIPEALVEPWGLLDPLATISGFRVLPVVGRIDPGYVAIPDPREVAEAFEVPLAYLLDAANVASRPFVHEGRARQVLEYAHPGHRIWGVTASILANLRTRLERLP